MSNKSMAFEPAVFVPGSDSTAAKSLDRIVKELQLIPVTKLRSYKIGRPDSIDSALNSAIDLVDRIGKLSPNAPGMSEALRAEALDIGWRVVGWLQEFSLANPIEDCGGTPGGTGKGSRTYSLDAMIDSGKEPEGGSWSYNDTV